MHAHAGHSHAHTDDSRRLTIALVLLLAFMAAEVVVGPSSARALPPVIAANAIGAARSCFARIGQA